MTKSWKERWYGLAVAPGAVPAGVVVGAAAVVDAGAWIDGVVAEEVADEPDEGTAGMREVAEVGCGRRDVPEGVEGAAALSAGAGEPFC